jgi:hypothetical protein
MRQVKWTIAILASLGGGLSAWAQDEGHSEKGSAFFDKTCVDFWGDKKPKEKPGQKGERHKRESLFVEPIQLPDGRTVLYTPPRPVLDFLESPTTENAQKYVQWQRERMKRLREAVEKLAQVSEAAEAGDLKKDSVKFDLVYFKQDGCPACARQDAILGELADLLEVRPVTARDELEASGVSSVPTLILRDPVTKRAVRLEGVTGKRELLEAMRSLREGRDADAPASGRNLDSKEKK